MNKIIIPILFLVLLTGSGCTSVAIRHWMTDETFMTYPGVKGDGEALASLFDIENTLERNPAPFLTLLTTPVAVAAFLADLPFSFLLDSIMYHWDAKRLERIEREKALPVHHKEMQGVPDPGS